MNFVAKEQVTNRPISTARRQSNVSSIHSSFNLGRALAGQSIKESLSNDKKLRESIDKELVEQSYSEPSNELGSVDNQSVRVVGRTISEFSNTFVGQSVVSMSPNDPLIYATRLCRLLKNNQEEFIDEKNSKDLKTLDNLRGMVR